MGRSRCEGMLQDVSDDISGTPKAISGAPCSLNFDSIRSKGRVPDFPGIRSSGHALNVMNIPELKELPSGTSRRDLSSAFEASGSRLGRAVEARYPSSDDTGSFE